MFLAAVQKILPVKTLIAKDIPSSPINTMTPMERRWTLGDTTDILATFESKIVILWTKGGWDI